MPDEPTANKTITLVYIGPVKLTTGKQGHEYQQAEGAPPRLRESRCYQKHLLKCQPGTMLTITETPEGKVMIASAAYAGQWPNQEDRIKWTAQARAHALSLDLEKQAQENPLFAALEPLRNAYRQTVAPRRAAMLADFIRFITG